AYVGGITRVRGLFEMVSAVQQLPDSYNTTLALAGPFFPSKLRSELNEVLASDGSNKRVEILGYLTRDAVSELLNKARIGIVTLHPTEKYVESYPTKLFEYMSVGIPVVASNFPVWREIVENAKCGLVVDPLDPTAIASAIRWLFDNVQEAKRMGERGRVAVEEKYNWALEGEKLLELYRRLNRSKRLSSISGDTPQGD
ncbi:MAG: glycosyltransferase, partial [Rubricoccaceae bacterium]|nr:glycosyltransferase [Rubricoccaceae bacterium]